MTVSTPILRKNYLPPDFLIHTVDLIFELHPTETVVRNTLHIERNSHAVNGRAPLVLNGQKLILKSIYLNDQLLTDQDYELTDTLLTIPQVSDRFCLTIETTCNPEGNTVLEGLYLSNEIFCTQCEPHGFQKITYYMDRPDVMAVFTTTIIADAKQYPILLSNGNLVEEKILSDGRQQVTWHDPFKKPCYLFALVGGNLEYLEDFFITQSKRRILLRIFVDPQQTHKALHAMAMLKKAMQFDEELYGREYDLDIFMIVAVRDFNMGAMENKGLNIFNEKYILVDEETATDEDFVNVGVVVAHEYFHNWTGNRVTCRDWFQLSLKEGLTVFRDQQFCGTLITDPIARIDEVRYLKSHQFPQDSGPLAHPVRPDQYMDMNNFYTVTVYHKGAEVVRMLHTLEGEENFRRGMDLYFGRFDGMAVTCDDFIDAHADANHQNYTQFMRWYSQAGTPQLNFLDTFEAASQTYRLCVSQNTPPTADGSPKEAFHLPIHLALFDRKSGKKLVDQMLTLTAAMQCFEFKNLSEKPIPSLVRNFSAPVKWHYPYTLEERIFLLQHEGDVFTRFQIGQDLYWEYFNNVATVNREYLEALKTILKDSQLDPAIRARLLSTPTYDELAKLQEKIDVQGIIGRRDDLNQKIAKALEKEALEEYLSIALAPSNTMGQRQLKACCLQILLVAQHPNAQEFAKKLFMSSKNMTDRYNALTLLTKFANANFFEQALEAFYNRYKNNELVLGKWFKLEASIPHISTIARVKKLLDHPKFDWHNPNKIYALLVSFAQNFVAFHLIDGSAYEFFAEQILRVDHINPIVAARLVEALTHWKQYQDSHAVLMRSALQSIALADNISLTLRELTDKSLR